MPNRILRDSIRTSDSLARLTAEEERHFYRLITLADDHGRFDARPEVIKGACYPLLLDSISTADVGKWTQRLASADIGILLLYEVDGRRYGVFQQWDKYQRVRSATSKFPEPPSFAVKCPQVLSNAPVTVVVNENGNEVGDGNEILDANASASPAVKQTPWEPPEFFKPLTELEGYKRRNHQKAADTIKATCEAQDVSPGAVVAQFANYYQGNRFRHGWSDPVASLTKTLPVQISKAKGEPYANNGRQRNISAHSSRNSKAQSGEGSSGGGDPLADDIAIVKRERDEGKRPYPGETPEAFDARRKSKAGVSVDSLPREG